MFNNIIITSEENPFIKSFSNMIAGKNNIVTSLKENIFS